MKYIQLNNTDLNISRICLGTAGFGDKLDQEKSFEVLDAFVRAGGNFIDTANVYCPVSYTHLTLPTNREV